MNEEIKLYISAKLEYRILGSVLDPDDTMISLNLDPPGQTLCLCLQSFPEKMLIQYKSIENIPEELIKLDVLRSAEKYHSFQSVGEHEFLGELNLEMYKQNQEVINRLKQQKSKVKIPEKRTSFENSIQTAEKVQTMFEIWFTKNGFSNYKPQKENFKQKVYNYWDSVGKDPNNKDPEIETQFKENPSYRARIKDYIHNRYKPKYESTLNYKPGINIPNMTITEFCQQIGCPESHFEPLVYPSFKNYAEKKFKRLKIEITDVVISGIPTKNIIFIII